MIAETPPGGTQLRSSVPSPWDVPSGRTEPGAVSRENTKSAWARAKADSIDAGKRYGRYEVIATLQRGGMGEVLLADINEGGRKSRVVLKRLLADLLEDEKYVAMFRVEAQVMSRLDHPNIVKVLDVPVIEGKQCLAMEYIEGVNVYQVLKRCRAISTQVPPQVALYIMLEVLKGLQYAHSAVLDDGSPLHLVHRDVTPGNLLVSFGGDVKITDFGIAKSSMSSLSTTVGVVKGTTRYLSPEQIRGEAASHRSDLFSCASVLVELFTGTPLFDRGSVPPTLFAIASGERPQIAKLLPFDAPRIAAVLERALSVRPELRYASAKAFGDELVEAAAELGPPIDRAGLAAFLQQLFPERTSSTAAEEGAQVALVDKMSLTYLFEFRDPIAWGAEKGDLAPACPEPQIVPEFEPIKSMITGSQPLDASVFDDGREEGRFGRFLSSQQRKLRNVVEIHVHGNREGSPPVPAPSTSGLLTSPREDTPSDFGSRSLSDVLVVPVQSRSRSGSDPSLRRSLSDAPLPPPVTVAAPPPPPPPASIAALPLIPPEANVADAVLPPLGLTPLESSGVHAVRPPRPGSSRFLLFLLGVVAGVLCMRFLDVAESDQLVVKREPHAIVAVVTSPEPAAAEGAAVERTVEPVQAEDLAQTVGRAREPPRAAERAPESPRAVERAPEPPRAAEPSRSVEVPRDGGIIDIRRPRGARVLIDGAFITKKTPIIGWRLPKGPHKVVVVKGSSKKTYAFEVADGDRIDLSRLEPR